VLIGFGVHHVFVGCWRAWWTARLPPPSLWPALFGLGIGLTLLLALACRRCCSWRRCRRCA
jgi:putative ABC transport system permease protein